ncbi:MAG: NAD(P)-dependent oxidoreductase [Oscillospiraceae bacterium]
MKHTLVGYTGFVGGNLAASHTFDNMYNSSNITQSFGQQNGLVVYAGMPSEKFLANADPAADLAQAKNALENIRRMQPRQVVLISTVDVYPQPVEVWEDTQIQDEDAPAYGKNRHTLEKWVREEFEDALILRLPGLFGRGLKKNFLYDLLTITPSALTQQKYQELLPKHPLIEKAYKEGAGGFYRLQPLTEQDAKDLYGFFENNDFNSLAFTDSRAVYQFYNLNYLWEHIQLCLQQNIRLVNLAVAPLSAAEIYKAIRNVNFENHLPKPPAQYDMRTRYAEALGAQGEYLFTAQQVLQDIALFAQNWQKN